MDRAQSVGQADVLQELGDTLNDKSTSITEDLYAAKQPLRTRSDPLLTPP
ncbi:MAG: hypothetical protein Ct9H300mP15_29260 [Gemmatimonadota bacterium]|nr:MAG: hypothetical protein Ct9H300mP15_29260 [Gemmatimonadota bacterium]